MKRSLLLALLITSGFISYSQKQLQGGRKLKPSVKEILATGTRLMKLPDANDERSEMLRVKSGEKKSSPQYTLPVAAYGTTIGFTFFDLQTGGGSPHALQVYDNGTIGAIWQYGRGKALGGRMAGYNYFNGTNWLYSGIADSLNYQIGGPNNDCDGSDYDHCRQGYPSITATATKEVVTNYTFPGGTTEPSNIATYVHSAFGTGAWSPINSSPLFPESSFHHAVSNSTTIHVVTTVKDVRATPSFPELGVTDALSVMRSEDNGTTWTATIVDDISAANGYKGVKTSRFDIDANGNNVAFVFTAQRGGLNPGMETILYKSSDNGLTWNKKIVEQNTMTDTNNFQYVATTGSYFVERNDGAYSVLVDNRGKAHIAVGRGFVPVDTVDGNKDGYYYPNGGINPAFASLKYWNEDMAPAVASDASMKYVAGTVDVNRDGVVDIPSYGETGYPGDYPYAFCSYPTLSADAAGNIFILYSAVVEGTSDPDGKNTRDLYYIASRDYGNTWSPELNIAAKFENYDDGSGGTATLEESFPVANKHIGADSKLHYYSLVDLKSGCAGLGTDGYTAQTNWAANSINYTSTPVSKVLNSYISAFFPNSFCSGATYTVSYVAPDNLPAGAVLNVELDTTTARSFASDNNRVLILGSQVSAGTGTISFTVPAVSESIPSRIRLSFKRTDLDPSDPAYLISSKEYETSLSPGAPAILGVMSAFPNSTCFNQGSSATFQSYDATSATEYVWTLVPAEAGQISITDNRATVYFSYNYLGSATISIAGKNACGTGPFTSRTFKIIQRGQLIGFYNADNFGFEIKNDVGGEYSWTVNGVEDPSQTSGFYNSTDDNFIPGTTTCAALTSSPDCKWCFHATDFTDTVTVKARKLSTMSLYPNPASTAINVRAENLAAGTAATVKLYDNLGRELENRSLGAEGFAAFNVQNYPKGMYTIKLTADKQVLTRKVVIQ
ncbi:MAG: T9SS type A sorting domain-containing protein [Bacteroidota bacterium]